MEKPWCHSILLLFPIKTGWPSRLILPFLFSLWTCTWIWMQPWSRSCSLLSVSIIALCSFWDPCNYKPCSPVYLSVITSSKFWKCLYSSSFFLCLPWLCIYTTLISNISPLTPQGFAVLLKALVGLWKARSAAPAHKQLCCWHGDSSECECVPESSGGITEAARH